ncbi:hypothetical protein [Enterococcus lemanii]|uniref:Uncharacterized protein n=1 Tax=Enterococcus lemanii TaxID=1159752 RepID=A0ABV9MXM5_9ENTE|nr:hypothetical protein [Enterococcus lemanii]MBM7710423.1 hypothetical protein [Enterococcus lemanii]
MSEKKFVDTWLSCEEYQWCLHCERVSLRSQWIDYKSCMYCGASCIDAWEWSLNQTFVVARKYPEIPVLGKKYPMCP